MQTTSSVIDSNTSTGIGCDYGTSAENQEATNLRNGEGRSKSVLRVCMQLAGVEWLVVCGSYGATTGARDVYIVELGSCRDSHSISARTALHA